MTKTPVAELAPNTYEFETTPLVKPTGFREYDARWWFGHPASDKPPELNLIGLQNIGSALGALVQEVAGKPDIVVGHDDRPVELDVGPRLLVGGGVTDDRSVTSHGEIEVILGEGFLEFTRLEFHQLELDPELGGQPMYQVDLQAYDLLRLVAIGEGG